MGGIPELNAVRTANMVIVGRKRPPRRIQWGTENFNSQLEDIYQRYLPKNRIVPYFPPPI